MATSPSKDTVQMTASSMLSPVLSTEDPLFLVPFVKPQANALGVQELAPDVVVAIGLALSQLELSNGDHVASPWERAAVQTGIMNRLSTGV